MICSDAFTSLVTAESQVLGVPNLRVVAIRHPLGGLGPADVRGRALEAVDAVAAILTGATP
jgi:hypothetical protein